MTLDENWAQIMTRLKRAWVRKATMRPSVAFNMIPSPPCFTARSSGMISSVGFLYQMHHFLPEFTFGLNRAEDTCLLFAKFGIDFHETSHDWNLSRPLTWTCFDGSLWCCVLGYVLHDLSVIYTEITGHFNYTQVDWRLSETIVSHQPPKTGQDFVQNRDV